MVNGFKKLHKSIKARGTEGKCTPITKPGCTGRAKALAKTFKKMAAEKEGFIMKNEFGKYLNKDGYLKGGLNVKNEAPRNTSMKDVKTSAWRRSGCSNTW